MKKWTAIAFVLLMLFVCACAEDILKEEKFYSAPDDLYFHQHPACSGRSDLTEITNTDALYPCPVCVDDPVAHEIPEAFTLGDIVVIRMPDKWMCERPDIGTVFASWDKECYADYEADAVISEYLHGADYRNFLNSNGFPTYAYYPSIYGTTNYSKRHIGDSWYVVTHLPATYTATDSEGKTITSAAQRTKDTWYGYLRFFGGRMWQQDGLTCYYTPAEWGERGYSMPTEAMTEEPLFVSCQNDQRISVYKHEDIYLCVVIDTIDFDDYTTVLLDGKPIGSWIRILDGKLCFALTGAEVFKLQNGARMDILTAFLEDNAFENSSFAMINNTGFNFKDYYPGVIDRNGNRLTPDIYRSIVRFGNLFFCERRAYDVQEKTGGMDVYDFTKSDEPLYVYSEPDASIYLEHVWEDAFLVEYTGDNSRFVLYDMHTGEALKELHYAFGKQGKYFGALNTEYVYTDGNSERICWIQGGTATLSDNYMNEIAEFTDCKAFLPLTWSGDNGLFLLIYGEDTWNLPVFGDLFRHGFDAGDYYPYFGEHEYDDPWDEEYETDLEEEDDGNIMEIELSDITFGLVDENGNAVTDMDYTYIRVISKKQVEIGRRDGTRILVETER